MPLFLYLFYKVTLLDIITNSCFTATCAFFSRFLFIIYVIKSVFGVTDRTPEVLSLRFEYRSRKKCIWIVIRFVTALWSDLSMTYCSSRKTVSPREKVWSAGFYPNLFS